jgi:hypothetical protein
VIALPEGVQHRERIIRVIRVLMALYAALCVVALWFIPASVHGWLGVEPDPLAAVLALLLALPWSLLLRLVGEPGPSSACSPHRACEDVVDQGLIWYPLLCSGDLEAAQHLRIDPHRDRRPRGTPQGRPPDPAHARELLVGQLRNVSEVDLALRHIGCAPSCSPGAR